MTTPSQQSVPGAFTGSTCEQRQSTDTMAQATRWIRAARLRTLPLALSGVIMGCGLALFHQAFQLSVSLLAVVTATLIQIFSNFANDYGDGLKQTDNRYRLGPARAVQSGEIGKRELERGMAVVAGLSFVCGVWLVHEAVWETSRVAFAAFVLIGVLALVAAYFYTAGRRAYGYIGLGDLFVFVFFGLVPVAGVFFLNTGFLRPDVFLPAISIGLFSTGVLNLNNMRDVDNDRNSGKLTLPVRMGPGKARAYHALLIGCGWVAACAYAASHWHTLWQWLFVATLPLFIRDLQRVCRIRRAGDLDPFLKGLALSTLAFTLLFCAGLLLSPPSGGI